ncbi:MAG: DUF4870 domain-containing protein [Elusimicrobia bacterium]|nr:DUF4870 domain-containing protein [Elusimicrobiota bacterium]
MDETESKTQLGVSQNTEALLCYVFGFVTGFIFLLLEKDNKFVRFHAMQSLVTFLGLFVASVLCHFVPVFGWIVGLILVPLQVVLWVLLMFKAYSGERYMLPIAGEIAQKQLSV